MKWPPARGGDRFRLAVFPLLPLLPDVVTKRNTCLAELQLSVRLFPLLPRFRFPTKWTQAVPKVLGATELSANTASAAHVSAYDTDPKLFAAYLALLVSHSSPSHLCGRQIMVGPQRAITCLHVRLFSLKV